MCFTCIYICALYAWYLKRFEVAVDSPETGVTDVANCHVDARNLIQSSGSAASFQLRSLPSFSPLSTYKTISGMLGGVCKIQNTKLTKPTHPTKLKMKQSLYSLVWILKTLQHTETNVSGTREKPWKPLHSCVFRQLQYRANGRLCHN